MARSSARDCFVRLEDADWKFASTSLKEEYWELKEQLAPKMPNPNTADLAEGVKGFSESFSHAFRTNPAIRKLRAFVGEKLRRGDLEARGLRTEPEVGKAQEIIPPFYFDHAKIDWEHNIVEKFGVRFEAVEVRKPTKTKESDGKQEANSSPAHEFKHNEPLKKRSPQSNRSEIVAAIAVLDRQGFDLRGPNKPYYEAILKQLGKSSTDSGYSHSVLYDCLKDYLSKKLVRQF
jgi:hypothetical protein